MGWLAVAYVVLATQYALNGATLPVDELANPLATALISIGIASFNCGMMYYLAAPDNPKRRQLALAVSPSLLLSLAAALGVALYRPWIYLPYAIGLCVVVKAAFDAARREPKAGHTWLALGMLSIPAVMVAAITLSRDGFSIRYYVMLPGIFFGIMLLTVSLVRRSKAMEAENTQRLQAERALTTLNASLEATVASRAADLQNIVTGLESFNRNVSHDLQGSLGGMSGLARMADEALRGKDLTVARVGDQAVTKKQVDLNALTQEAIASATLAKSAEKQPRFIVGQLPPLHADAALLRPALTNLLGNAIKFCGYRPDGCVGVQARVDSDAQETIIQVRDNGVGFLAASANELFQPYARLHGDEFAGHGVGLSIVRRAVERQGGRVWAESELGKGASFFFSLPNVPTAEVSALPPEFAEVKQAVALQTGD